jgi:hypothetical protein
MSEQRLRGGLLFRAQLAMKPDRKRTAAKALVAHRTLDPQGLQ